MKRTADPILRAAFTFAITFCALQLGGQPAPQVQSAPAVEQGFRNWRSDARTSVLWPGEQIECGNLTVRWDFPTTHTAENIETISADDRDSSPSIGSKGRLVITGPGIESKEVPLPIGLEAASSSIGSVRRKESAPMTAKVTSFYAIDTVIVAEPEPSDDPIKVFLVDWRQPSQIELGGMQQGGHQVFVSHDSPLTIETLQLHVSADARTYPDGSNYHELYLSDSAVGTSISMPLAKGSRRNIGRFVIDVKLFRSLGKTAEIGILANTDYTSRGLQTVIADRRIYVYPTETLSQFLDRIGKKYEFQVRWSDEPGYPGSAELVKNSRSMLETLPSDLTTTKTSHHMDWTVFQILSSNLRDPIRQTGLNLRMLAEDELLVQPTRSLVETHLMKEKIAREREEFPQIFARKYSPETRAYPLKPKTATTAKALVEQELRTYFLAESDAVKDIPGDREVLHDGSELEIAAVPVTTEIGKVTSVTREYVVHDPKADVLVANAIPATHKKIEETLQKVQSLISHPSAAPNAMPSFRVDIILLEGVKAGSASTTGSADLAKYGLTEEDLSLFGIESVVPVGSGVMNMVVRPGHLDKARVMLSDSYSAELGVLEYQKPHLILEGTLRKGSIPLIDNTLYLEPGKPTLLGLTNLKEALILVVHVRE